jgi:carboxymethylenebutenolidase
MGGVLDRPAADIHAEFVKFASGTDTLVAYIAYPEPADPAPAMLVIHENVGMSPLVRDAAQRLARKGYVAIAPDLLSRRGGTPATPDSAHRLIASLNPDTITQDLDAAVAYVRALPAVDSTRLGAIGFGWGGGESLRYASHNQSLRAFVIVYGPVPKVYFDFATIKAPGFGVYADRDGRVTDGVYNLVRDLQKAKVSLRFKVYPNTIHGFLGTRVPPEMEAEAWKDILAFLSVGLK